MEPSHIVAAKDAIIKSIVTRAGTPLVKPGTIVRKGDKLVSGILTIKGDFDDVLRYQPTVADADIICSSFYNYYDSFRMTYIGEIHTGNMKKGYFIAFAGKKLFLYNPRYSYDKYDIIVNENTVHITNSFYLPFRYGTISTREYYEEVKTYTQEEATAIAEARLKRYFKRLSENNVLIKENNVKITIENNYCIARGRILVEEPAWEYRTISEDEWRIEQTDEHNGNNH
jgi:similar to stage IV sporulation protein